MDRKYPGKEKENLSLAFDDYRKKVGFLFGGVYNFFYLSIWEKDIFFYNKR